MSPIDGSDGDDEDEEFYLKVEVSSDLVVNLTTAEDEFNEAKKTLFATFVWTGSMLLARKLVALQPSIRAAAVLEFGSAAGLPSIVAAKLGAAAVCASDYPSPCVLDALRKNIVKNDVASVVSTVDHIWGEPVERLLAANQGLQYDIVLAAECLWRHESHPALLASILGVLKKTGILLLAYSHHIPGLEANDDHFLELCAQAGLIVASHETLPGKHMWSDNQVDIYICALQFRIDSS